MRKERALISVAVFAFALAACGGGGSGGGSATVPAPPGTGGGLQLSAQQQQQDSVAAANAAGAPVEDISGIETSVTNPVTLQSSGRKVADTANASPTPGTSPSPGAGATPAPPVPTAPPNGACIPNFFASGTYKGFEYWKPDKAGDPNSVEYAFFYDAACTQIARDQVRIVGSVSGTGAVKTQTQTVTTTEFDQGKSVPTDIRTETNTLTGQFDAENYPLLKLGFARASVLSVSAGGTVVMNRANEFVAGPTSSASQTYCGDSAGFNAEKLASTAQVHGWQNLTANASRTVNSDGSITWTNSSSGSVYSAATAGSFSINKGQLNSACPITVPAFTLAGGTLVSSYGVSAMSATFKSGGLVMLTVTNATLANGYTLNVTTNTAVAPTSPNFINGTIAKGGTTIATFSVDANGNGTMTVTATGAKFTMNHWHVVKDEPSASPSPSPSASPSPAPSPSPH